MKKENYKRGEKGTVTIRLDNETLEIIKELSIKNNSDVSKEIRSAIEKHLDVEIARQNIDFVTDLIRQEINISHKKLGNRLGAISNRTNIVTATIYYLLIAVLTDLIPKDLYTDFEEIQQRAKRYGLEFANSKSEIGIQNFLSDEETKKAVEEILTGYSGF